MKAAHDLGSSKSIPIGLIVGNNTSRLWGMTSRERLRRGMTQAGVAPVATAPDRGFVVVASDAWVFDAKLLRDLAARPGVVLFDEASGVAVAAHVEAAQLSTLIGALSLPASPLPAELEHLTPSQLSGNYNHQLRKRETPYLLRLTPATRADIEQLTFGASYKGVTDVVTKYLWPRPARAVTRLCAELRMTPNQVTSIGFALTLLSFWLFWNGQYAAGLLSGWLMTFLDTVDGKLARVTLTSSKFGNAFDHGIDLIHPPFWWWAWVTGLSAYGTPLPPSTSTIVLTAILAGYVVQRILEGIFNLLFGMHVHVWRRFDSIFRLWTARRNPNLLILTPALLLGRPDTGIVLVAWWTALCLLVHAAQIVQALLARRRGPLQSWLDR